MWIDIAGQTFVIDLILVTYCTSYQYLMVHTYLIRHIDMTIIKADTCMRYATHI